MGIERREKERLVPGDTTFVALRPDFVNLGKILDISRGGLCFQYMTTGDMKLGAGSMEIDIFRTNNGYYVPSVPCKIVYEREAPRGESIFTGMKNRRCGVKFGHLTREQTDMVELYLRKNTRDTV